MIIHANGGVERSVCCYHRLKSVTTYFRIYLFFKFCRQSSDYLEQSCPFMYHLLGGVKGSWLDRARFGVFPVGGSVGPDGLLSIFQGL